MINILKSWCLVEVTGRGAAGDTGVSVGATAASLAGSCVITLYFDRSGRITSHYSDGKGWVKGSKRRLKVHITK